MREPTHTIYVKLPLEDGPVTLIAEVLTTEESNVYLVRQVSFQKDWDVVPFMNEFHLEKRKVNSKFLWLHKERGSPTMIGQAIGKAIDENPAIARLFAKKNKNNNKWHSC